MGVCITTNVCVDEIFGCIWPCSTTYCGLCNILFACKNEGKLLFFLLSLPPSLSLSLLLFLPPRSVFFIDHRHTWPSVPVALLVRWRNNSNDFYQLSPVGSPPSAWPALLHDLSLDCGFDATINFVCISSSCVWGGLINALDSV